MVTVYISSIRADDEREADRLIELSKTRNKEEYTIVHEPAKADIILLTDIVFRDFGRQIMNNYLINKYPNKCFVIATKDNPINFFRGLYASAEKSLLDFRRIRTCAYNTYPFKNNSIQNDNEAEVPKKYLFSFVGANSHPVRKRILELKFKREDICIIDTSHSFNLWNERNTVGGQSEYVAALLSSKFSLCPRGAGASSIRLFESMKLGIAPVIISDEWIFPNGPDWRRFSIIIKYNQLHLIEDIVSDYENRWCEMGKLAKEAYNRYFDDSVYFDYLMDNCLAIQQNQLFPEGLYL